MLTQPFNQLNHCNRSEGKRPTLIPLSKIIKKHVVSTIFARSKQEADKLQVSIEAVWSSIALLSQRQVTLPSSLSMSKAWRNKELDWIESRNKEMLGQGTLGCCRSRLRVKCGTAVNVTKGPSIQLMMLLARNVTIRNARGARLS